VGLDPGAISLAAFHTLFIGLGVAIFLPMLQQFASLIERLLPDAGPSLTRHLDDSLLETPEVALEVTNRALKQTAMTLIRAYAERLSGPATVASRELEQQTAEALETIERFFERIPSVSGPARKCHSPSAQIHAIDHLLRLHNRLRSLDGLDLRLQDARLLPAREACTRIMEAARQGLSGDVTEHQMEYLRAEAESLGGMHERLRLEMLTQVQPSGQAQGTLGVLDALRSMVRAGQHASRIVFYLQDTSTESEPMAQAQG